jgi:flagellar motor switch protein FliG
MLVAAKSKEFRNKIFGCISAGRQKNVQDEIEINSPYRKSDCESITSGFFSVLRRAYENGELIIKGRNEEEYV